MHVLHECCPLHIPVWEISSELTVWISVAGDVLHQVYDTIQFPGAGGVRFPGLVCTAEVPIPQVRDQPREILGGYCGRQLCNPR